MKPSSFSCSAVCGCGWPNSQLPLNPNSILSLAGMQPEHAPRRGSTDTRQKATSSEDVALKRQGAGTFAGGWVKRETPPECRYLMTGGQDHLSEDPGAETRKSGGVGMASPPQGMEPWPKLGESQRRNRFKIHQSTAQS